MMVPAYTIALLAILAAPGELSVEGRVALREVTPDDPVLWWTLTDELSPQALRASHGDPSLNVERYQKAVREGWADEVAPERLQRLVFYVNGASTPEQVPMWLAFWKYAGRTGPSPLRAVTGEDLEASRTELVRYGFDASAADLIVETALWQDTTEARLRQQYAPRIEELFEIVSRSEAELAKSGSQHGDLLETGEVEKIAASAGEDVAKVDRLWRIWKRDPPRETVVAALSLLERELAPDEMRLFRRYLLESVAVRTRTTVWKQEGVP